MIRRERLREVELAFRMGQADARACAEALLAEARALGDGAACSRLLEALGHQAMAAREDERAVELFEAARRAASGGPPRERPVLYASLGRAYAGLGDLGRAAGVLGEAWADAVRAPRDVRLMVRVGTVLANVYTDAGRFAEAEEVLATLLAHEDEITDELSKVRAEWALARTYGEQGRSALAERYSRRVLARLEPYEEAETTGRAHLLLAGILLDRGAVDDARPHLAEAERLMAPTAARPEMALVTVERARAALLADELDDAERLARRALDEVEATEPGIAGSALATLAETALAQGELDDARFLAEQAVERLGTTVAPHYVAKAFDTLSRVHEAAGDLPAALAAARRAADHRAGAGRRR